MCVWIYEIEGHIASVGSFKGMLYVCIDLVNDEIEAIEGNQTRDLWKLACWEMARDVSELLCTKNAQCSPHF